MLRYSIVGGRRWNKTTELRSSRCTQAAMRTLVLALAICLAFVHVSDGARAIFFFHGMMNSGSSFDRVIAAVQRVRPEATLFSLPIFESVDGSQNSHTDRNALK
jgi:hypothetical protein